MVAKAARSIGLLALLGSINGQALANAPAKGPCFSVAEELSPIGDIFHGFIGLMGLDFTRFLYKNVVEIRWLKELIGNEPNTSPPEGSWSVEMFKGAWRPEFDRTALSIDSFQEIALGDYEGLTGHLANSPIRPSRELFEELRTRILKPLAFGKFDGPFSNDLGELSKQIDHGKLVSMVVFMASHDISKVKRLASSIEKISGRADADHDRILVTGLDQNQQLVAPTVDCLKTSIRNWFDPSSKASLLT